MKHIHILILALLLSVSVVAQEKQNNFEIAKSLDIYNSLLRELNLNYHGLHPRVGHRKRQVHDHG